MRLVRGKKKRQISSGQAACSDGTAATSLLNRLPLSNSAAAQWMPRLLHTIGTIRTEGGM